MTTERWHSFSKYLGCGIWATLRTSAKFLGNIELLHLALTGELRSGGPKEGNETGRIDDASACLKPLGRVCGVVSHGLDGIFAPPPNTFEVNLHGQIPARTRTSDLRCEM